MRDIQTAYNARITRSDNRYAQFDDLIFLISQTSLTVCVTIVRMKLAVQVAISILAAVITAASYALNILNVWPTAGLKWVTLSAFVIFVGISYWMLYRSRAKIRELENKTPTIDYALHSNLSNEQILTITNNGASGRFKALLQVTSTNQSMNIRLLNLHWMVANSDEATINNGLTDCVVLAQKVISTQIGTAHWVILAHNPATNANIHSTQSSSWVVGQEATCPVHYEGKITVSSDNTLRGGALKLKFEIDNNGMTLTKM